MSEFLKLSELLLLIRETIDLALPEYYNVVAEIHSINVNKKSGHAYLELIEKDTESDTVIAKIKGIIWNRTFRVLSAYFEDITGSELKSGMKILFKGYVNFSEVYGLSFIITSIDPNYTIGDLARKRQEIIEKLQNEGIIDLNKTLEFPLVPQRIAIISSPTAAGFEDFVNQLKTNPYGYDFYFELFEAVMQGEQTEKSIILALENIYEKIDDFDLVVIIRGGGSRFDLSAFDSYELATNIAQFPLPVITGIGHERDLSVADLVAHKSLKTPTAVADFLIAHIHNFEIELQDLKNKIFYLVEKQLNFHNDQLRIFANKLNDFASNFHINKTKELKNLETDLMRKIDNFFYKKFSQLDEKQNSLKFLAFDLIRKNEKNLNNLKQKFDVALKIYFFEKEKNLDILNTKFEQLEPKRILQRGYSITTKNGKLITSIDELQEGDIVETTIADGKFQSIVKNKKQI